jgi:hypothetical protein
MVVTTGNTNVVVMSTLAGASSLKFVPVIDNSRVLSMQ